MKLFLSSWDPQGIPAELAALVGARRECAVIANANDAESTEFRTAILDRTTAALRVAGFVPTELDLRDYTNDTAAIASRLSSCALVWAVGGNAFVLRVAMRRSGFDAQIGALLRTNKLTYGGSSAGAIVAGTTLRGVELVDPPEALRSVGYPSPVWDGMRLVDFAIAPHFGSTGPMGKAVDRLVAAMKRSGIRFRALRDGQSLSVNGARVTLVDHSAQAAAISAKIALDMKHNRN